MKRIDPFAELFPGETPATRLQARVLEGFLVASMLRYCWRWASVMYDFREVIRPHGVARYVDLRFLFGPAAYWNAAFVTVAALLGASRVSPRVGYSLALCGFHIQCVGRHSQGKLFHDSTFIGIGMVVLSAAMWLFHDPANRRVFTLGASVFCYGLSYVSAAVSKLVHTGPSWIDGRHMWLWIAEKSVDGMAARGTMELSWLQERILASYTLATAILTIGLCSELAGFLLWFRRTRPLIALALLGMHVGIYLTMDILFESNIYLMLIMAVPWAHLVASLPQPAALEAR